MTRHTLLLGTDTSDELLNAEREIAAHHFNPIGTTANSAPANTVARLAFGEDRWAIWLKAHPLECLMDALLRG